MKHFVLFFLVSFFVVFNIDVNAKVEQSLNEYKIEQLQKGIDDLKKEIDELKKDVDDKKEKQIENKATNESLDKRIGDISGSVDRFGIIAGILGFLITIGLAISGWLGYTKAKTESKEVAKEESEKVTKNWINNEASKQLQEKIKELEIDAQEKIAKAVQNAKDEIKQQSKAEEHFMQGNSHFHNKDYEKAKEYYQKAADMGNSDALNNLGVLYSKQGNYEKAKEYYLKAVEKGIYQGFNNLGRLYEEQEDYSGAIEYYQKSINCGFDIALNNLGNIYKKQKDYIKAEEYYVKAVEKGDRFALLNLRDLYSEQKEYEKLKELKQTHKNLIGEKN